MDRKIENFMIRKDGQIDVYGSVLLNKFEDDKLPYKFRYVQGNFFIIDSKLKTLKNCPNIVTDEFNCSFSQDLKSLKDCPKIIGKTFKAEGINLESIDDFPRKFNHPFIIDLSGNNISEVKNLPTQFPSQKYNINLDLSGNCLSSLRGIPSVSFLNIKGTRNNLKNFKGLKDCSEIWLSLNSFENAEEFCYTLPPSIKYLKVDEDSKQLKIYNEIKTLLKSDEKFKNIKLY
jgi:hypothetical protein